MGDDAPVTRAEFNRVLGLMEKLVEQKEQPAQPAPVVPAEDQRIAASEERMARIEKRLDKLATLHTREAGGGQAPPVSTTIVDDPDRALRLSEEKLKATGKPYTASDAVALARKLKGEPLAEPLALRLSELGV